MQVCALFHFREFSKLATLVKVGPGGCLWWSLNLLYRYFLEWNMLTKGCFFGEINTKCIIHFNHKVIKVRLSKKENHLSEWALRIEPKMEATSFCYNKLKHKSHLATAGKSMIFFFLCIFVCRSSVACRFPCDLLVELGSDCPRQSKFRTEKLTIEKKREYK